MMMMTITLAIMTVMMIIMTTKMLIIIAHVDDYNDDYWISLTIMTIIMMMTIMGCC